LVWARKPLSWSRSTVLSGTITEACFGDWPWAKPEPDVNSTRATLSHMSLKRCIFLGLLPEQNPEKRQLSNNKPVLNSASKTRLCQDESFCSQARTSADSRY